MRKVLLIGLAISGLAFVPAHRSDAQISRGLPGVGGISFGFPGGYYAYPTRYNYYPYGVFTSGRTTIIPSNIRIITLAPDTLGITGAELITVTIVIITTAIDQL